MESLTAQSPSQPPQQPQQASLPLPDSPEQSQPDLSLQPEQPQPDLSPQASPQDLSPSEPTTETQPSAETQPAAEAEPSTQPEEQTAAPEPQAISYSTLDDVRLDDLTPEVRAHVEPILALVDHVQTELEQQKATYDELNTEITTLISGLSEAQKGNIEPLVVEYKTLSGAYTDMSKENIAMAQRMFGVEYPEFGNQPDKIRAAFVAALTSDRFHDRYEGDTIYDKMVDAYNMSVFRNGGTLRPAAAQPAPKAQPVVQQPVAQKPVNTSAKKQALVSGGTVSSNLPTLNLDNLSYEDILARGEHLLEL